MTRSVASVRGDGPRLEVLLLLPKVIWSRRSSIDRNEILSIDGLLLLLLLLGVATLESGAGRRSAVVRVVGTERGGLGVSRLLFLEVASRHHRRTRFGRSDDNL